MMDRIIAKPQDSREISIWERHYQEYLNEMYSRYIYNQISLSYGEFVYIAFCCSKTHLNENLKKTRPLV